MMQWNFNSDTGCWYMKNTEQEPTRNLFADWYNSQSGFYWDWLRQQITAKENWRKHLSDENLRLKNNIKELKENNENEVSHYKRLLEEMTHKYKELKNKNDL